MAVVGSLKFKPIVAREIGLELDDGSGRNLGTAVVGSLDERPTVRCVGVGIAGCQFNSIPE